MNYRCGFDSHLIKNLDFLFKLSRSGARNDGVDICRLQQTNISISGIKQRTDCLDS